MIFPLAMIALGITLVWVAIFGLREEVEKGILRDVFIIWWAGLVILGGLLYSFSDKIYKVLDEGDMFLALPILFFLPAFISLIVWGVIRNNLRPKLMSLWLLGIIFYYPWGTGSIFPEKYSRHFS